MRIPFKRITWVMSVTCALWVEAQSDASKATLQQSINDLDRINSNDIEHPDCSSNAKHCFRLGELVCNKLPPPTKAATFEAAAGGMKTLFRSIKQDLCSEIQVRSNLERCFISIDGKKTFLMDSNVFDAMGCEAMCRYTGPDTYIGAEFKLNRCADTGYADKPQSPINALFNRCMQSYAQFMEKGMAAKHVRSFDAEINDTQSTINRALEKTKRLMKKTLADLEKNPNYTQNKAMFKQLRCAVDATTFRNPMVRPILSAKDSPQKSNSAYDEYFPDTLDTMTGGYAGGPAVRAQWNALKGQKKDLSCMPEGYLPVITLGMPIYGSSEEALTTYFLHEMGHMVSSLNINANQTGHGATNVKKLIDEKGAPIPLDDLWKPTRDSIAANPNFMATQADEIIADVLAAKSLGLMWKEKRPSPESASAYFSLFCNGYSSKGGDIPTRPSPQKRIDSLFGEEKEIQKVYQRLDPNPSPACPTLRGDILSP